MQRKFKGWRSKKGVLIVAVIALVAGGAVAYAQLLPPNDLLILPPVAGQNVAAAPVQHNPEPKLAATPRIPCQSGSHPLGGVDGRVPASAINSSTAAHGYTCNLTEIAHQGQTGGFKTLRYVDTRGHVCAFYDQTLLFPLNALRLNTSSAGVAVLDMSNPSHPVLTDTLTQPPMQSPHESLSINPKRGLLGAVLGNPATHPGLVSIYDASKDCRHPVLDATALAAPFGHEGNFSPDGKTFWAAGTGTKSLTAIDVSNPKHPHAVWQGSEYSHGLTISDNGDRAYIADPITGQLLILDVSQIQARKANPKAREVSRLTWKTSTIPQNAIPITIGGTHYILEFDEYAFRFNRSAPPDTVGAARIINIANERHPFVVSNLRLQVDQPAAHHAASHDPGAIDPAQGYAAHYCNVPREVDPEIAACSFISSGLRVFDIRDPAHPREIAYFVAPPHKSTENGYDGSNFAMSKPAFDPGRREIWYTDGSSGFYVLRLNKNLWPDPRKPAPPRCPEPTSQLAGAHLGPIALGEKRTTVRKKFSRFSPRNRRNMDFYCFAGGGIRAGYPSAKLLGEIPHKQRVRVRGRVVLALTADGFYSLNGVTPASPLSAARKRLHLSKGFRVGANTWYLARGRHSTGLLKVRHGQVQEIGIADRRLTATNHDSWRFLESFD